MNKALIVVDVQKAFLDKNTKPIVGKIRDYLKKNLKDYKVIYFTIFKNDPDSPLWKIADFKDISNPPDTDLCDEIERFTNNKNLFYKNILSAYKVAEIKEGLKKNKISQVDLCGFDTDCCVLAAAYDLFDSGYKPVLLKDLTWSTSDEKLHDPALQIIDRNIGFVE